jgi:hypothetical protein
MRQTSLSAIISDPLTQLMTWEEALYQAWRNEEKGETAMIDAHPVALARMTWPEAAEALASAEVALVPVGATEQHGPNMSLETDTVVAYQLALRIATTLYPRVVVTPPLPYGVSYHHMHFAGTMTLSPETFQAVVLEVVLSLHRHGVERFFILDGHGPGRERHDARHYRRRLQRGSASGKDRSPSRRYRPCGHSSEARSLLGHDERTAHSSKCGGGLFEHEQRAGSLYQASRVRAR